MVPIILLLLDETHNEICQGKKRDVSQGNVREIHFPVLADNLVHVILKTKTIRPSKIKDVDSSAHETILMKNGLLACLFGYCMQCS